jgi:hypothetical protein
MGLALKIDPQHRRVSAPLSDAVPNPSDGLFVHEVRSSLKAVWSGQDENMLAGLNTGAVVKEVVDRGGDGL